jgi:hypothetical protein
MTARAYARHLPIKGRRKSILTFWPSMKRSFAQTLPQSGEEWSKCLRRRAVEESDHRRGLLSARRERPRRRTAEQRDESAAVARD